MKHFIFSVLLVTGLAVGVSVAVQSAEEPSGDLRSRLRQHYADLPLWGDAYRFERLELLKRVAEKVSNDYVEPDRVDPERMLDGALNFGARAVPEAMFDYEPGDQVIEGTVGSARRDIDVGKLAGIRDLTRVLEDVAAFLGETVPADTEMPDVEYALINGMLSTLDPHSVFIDPDAFEEMQITNEGDFGGLGITIGNRWKDGRSRLTILYPLPDTPAYSKGLMKQDRIVKIGGESTVNMSLEVAVSKLRGPPKTDITITIERDVESETLTFDVTLTREVIEVPSVKSFYLGDGVGGIQIIHFSEDTFDEMRLQIMDMENLARGEGLEGLEGLVLDLRDNPGGYLSQAIYISDKFLDAGVIVSTRGHGRQRGEVHEATRHDADTDLRLAMLVDTNSASASEIFAGAIRNLDRGVVLGVTTFGKGSVQNLYPFHHDGSALKLTIDHYLTPGEHSIQSVGIAPDIELRPVWVQEDGDAFLYWQDAAMREKDLDDHFDGGEEEEATNYACLHLDSDYYLWDEDYSRDDQPQMEDWAEDFQVQFAKTIVVNSSTPHRKQMLAESFPAIMEMMSEMDTELVDHMGTLGVDWTAGGAQGTPKARISMEIGHDSGVLPVGEKTPLTLSVTNEGDGPFVRLRAISDGDLLDGTEFVFGRVEPGETREWTTVLNPSLGMSSRTGEVTFHFDADGSRAPGDFVGNLRVEEKQRPRFAYNYEVVDDGSGASVGNGDGLLQRGEKIDLIVTVENIGEGPTGDQYLNPDSRPLAVGSPTARTPEVDPGTLVPASAADAVNDLPSPSLETGLEDEVDDEDGPSGIVKLSSNSGKSLFLTEGTGQFSLAPGESTHLTLHFDVAPAVADELLELELTIGDERFWDFFTDDLELVVYPDGAAETVAEHSKVYRTRGEVDVLAGAHSDSHRIASADGVITADGKAGDLVRVALPWGGRGWIAAAQLKGARGAAPDGSEIEPWIARSPPVVVLGSRIGGTFVESDSIEVQGVVRDDQAIKDLVVYVNGTKIFYRAVSSDETQSTVEFALEVALEDGNNLIEIVARDTEDLLGSTAIGVYRSNPEGAAARAD